MLTEGRTFACPWCGETNHVDLDPGDAGQWVVQDCAVCCRPIEIRLPADGETDPEIRRE